MEASEMQVVSGEFLRRNLPHFSNSPSFYGLKGRAGSQGFMAVIL